MLWLNLGQSSRNRGLHVFQLLNEFRHGRTKMERLFPASIQRIPEQVFIFKGNITPVTFAGLNTTQDINSHSMIVRAVRVRYFPRCDLRPIELSIRDQTNQPFDVNDVPPGRQTQRHTHHCKLLSVEAARCRPRLEQGSTRVPSISSTPQKKRSRY